MDRYKPIFGDPVGPWYKWFAWRPVQTVDRGRKWFCILYRRRIQKKINLPGTHDFWFQYAYDLRNQDVR